MFTTLSPQQRSSVRSLAELAAATDAKMPLNEAARFALEAEADHIHALASQYDELTGNKLIGYAQLDQRDASVQLFLVPAARGCGLGEWFTRHVQEAWQPASWWSFGTLPPAKGVAKKLGLVPVRQLAIMERSMDTGLPEVKWPDGITPTWFTEDDLAQLVRVNAAAFAHHPEQGQMSIDDARQRMAEPWFRPDDLLLAKTSDGRLAGFHWMKVTGHIGEVYVIGVDPQLAGGGIGRALLNAGLAHLHQRGVRNVELYVEADNAPVVKMYLTAGFKITNIDTSYQGG